MFKNSAVKIASSKFASAPLLPSSSILPFSLLLLSGIVVWKLWRKQGQLQTQTNELSDELKNIKKQVAKIKTTEKADTTLSPSLKKATDLSSASLKKMSDLSSASLKKMSDFSSASLEKLDQFKSRSKTK